jgi:hypothetical protein
MKQSNRRERGGITLLVTLALARTHYFLQNILSVCVVRTVVIDSWNMSAICVGMNMQATLVAWLPPLSAVIQCRCSRWVFMVREQYFVTSSLNYKSDMKMWLPRQ